MVHKLTNIFLNSWIGPNHSFLRYSSLFLLLTPVKKNNSIMTQKNKLGRKTGSCVLSESRSVKLDRAMRPMRKSEKQWMGKKNLLLQGSKLDQLFGAFKENKLLKRRRWQALEVVEEAKKTTSFQGVASNLSSFFAAQSSLDKRAAMTKTVRSLHKKKP